MRPLNGSCGLVKPFRAARQIVIAFIDMIWVGAQNRVAKTVVLTNAD